MDYFRSKTQFINDNCSSSSNDTSKTNNSTKKNAIIEYNTASTSGRRSKTKINVGLNTNSDDDVAIQWFSSSSCSSSRHSNENSSSKRKRRSSTSLDDKDPELGLDGPAAKRQHLPSTCYPHSSDPSSSVPSFVYPSPVDELVNETDTRSSDCVPPSYNLPIPDSPTSIDDDGVVPESESIASFETVSTTSPTHSDSECNQTFFDQSQPKIKSFDEYLTLFDCMTPVEPSEPRMCPLPALSWANAQDVWNLMCKKDEQASYLRDSTMLDNHPGLQPRMRAILLDWLIEVCEVYKLHRETYYLATDYLDRYLSTQKRVQKTHLQLIGITCLFIAAKVEEIYPPKIAEFAYVTDGACLEEDILQHEIVLLQALDWSISPVTSMGWLGVYMQLNISNRTPASLSDGTYSDSSKHDARTVDDAFIYPQFSGLEFVQTAQLLDLCSLDIGMGNYPYSVIAAAAISHTFNKETAIRVSGFDWGTIQPCARWMDPYFKVIVEESEHLYLMEQSEQISSKCGVSHSCPNIVTDDSHIIQTHTTSMTMFDRAYLISEQHAAMKKTTTTEASPATGLKCPEGLLTPPSSSRKPLDENDENDEEDDHRVQMTSSCTSQKENIENLPNMSIQKT